MRAARDLSKMLTNSIDIDIVFVTIIESSPRNDVSTHIMRLQSTSVMAGIGTLVRQCFALSGGYIVLL